MKRHLYQFIQHLAVSIFIGIAVYGIIIYMGGEVNKKIPVGTSLLLGLAAVICVVVFVTTGGVLDRMMAKGAEKEDAPEERKG
ncbi:MAG: hypothetical protein JSV26_04050 [bacterium]|nr:MAG: hypothetical protein JSV26_04050 [bacterium]